MKKKVLALFLAATMSLGSGVLVMAEEGSNASFHVSIEEVGSKEHTYQVYQIFRGSYSEDEFGRKILADIAWGSNAKGSVFVNGTTYTDAQKFASFLQGLTADELEMIRQDIFNSLDTSTPVTTIISKPGKKVTSDGLEAGYYLIEDVTDEANIGQDSYASFIIEVLGTVEVKAKSGTVTSEKKVDDINDSTGAFEALQDTADYDIGDRVPFTLTGTIPSNYELYNKFCYTFHDSMEKGLTFADDAKVYVIGKDKEEIEITDVFTKSLNTEDGCSFELSCEDLKKVADVYANATLKVTYSAFLNEDCVRGSQGNLNTSWITYSNNPNKEGLGETLKDDTIVFTYVVNVNKVDEKSEILSGAEFEIYKYDHETKAYVKCDVSVNEIGTSFTVDGIDDGFYKLVETKAPIGYNKLEKELYFAVDAAHGFTGFIDEENRNSILSLDAFEIDQEHGFVKVENNVTIQFQADETKGVVATDVVNKSGSFMPSTGGMGTTVFYIVGIVCVLGGGSLLFTRKRMKREED